MIAFDFLLALTLLTHPTDAPFEPGKGLEKLAYLRRSLQVLAVHLELLDPREARYILARVEDFVADVNLLRRRFRELHDAPLVADSLRFPDRATVNEFLAANRAYRQHVDVRQPVELAHWWELRAAVQETEHLYNVWDKVRDARCEFYYVHVRRDALKQLRNLVGEEAYASAQLPPSVPRWRLQRVR